MKPSSPRHVTLMTRSGCHLCDDAHTAISALADEIVFTWETVDVDVSPDLQDQYGDRVPVVLVDGREHGYWRVETDRLRAALIG
ncbi:MAG: glutaredoxin 2 [Pseudonocardiales bacterium]|nr:glutaredoxin 2 [Pseudonocardiales bacterium]